MHRTHESSDIIQRMPFAGIVFGLVLEFGALGLIALIVRALNLG